MLDTADRVNHWNSTPGVVERPRLVRLGDLVTEYEADAIAAHEAFATGKPRGPITGIAPLDHELGNVLQPGPHVLHSNSGTGKTAFAWQVATSAKHPNLYVTCEMGPLELMRRLVARVTDTYLGRLKSGELPPSDAIALFKRAAAAAPHTHLLDATKAYASPDYLLEVATLAKGDSPHFLLVLDSAHAWVRSGQAEVSEYEAMSAALTTVGQIARTLDCPVLLIAERSRAAMRDGGLNAAAGSRGFEYGAESVIGLDRKGHPDPRGASSVELTIDKNRNGPSGRKVSLMFYGAVQRFEVPRP